MPMPALDPPIDFDFWMYSCKKIGVAKIILEGLVARKCLELDWQNIYGGWHTLFVGIILQDIFRGNGVPKIFWQIRWQKYF